MTAPTVADALRAARAKIDDLLVKIRPLAAKAVVRDPYWIDGDNGIHETKYGSRWCDACVDEVVDRLNLYTPRGAFEATGGDASVEEDHCQHCAECAVILSYCLTDYGASQEADHFEEFTPTASVDDAYHVEQFLDAAKFSDDLSLLQIAVATGEQLIAAFDRAILAVEQESA